MLSRENYTEAHITDLRAQTGADDQRCRSQGGWCQI